VSVLIVQRVQGDTAQFEAFMAGNAELVEQLTDRAKAGGCLAHRFAVGDGEVIVADVWESEAQFDAFISLPEIQAVMGQMGAQGPPETAVVAEAKGFPGEF
jgi:quinol monooxygenase YgiN